MFGNYYSKNLKQKYITEIANKIEKQFFWWDNDALDRYISMLNKILLQIINFLYLFFLAVWLPLKHESQSNMKQWQCIFFQNTSVWEQSL